MAAETAQRRTQRRSLCEKGHEKVDEEKDGWGTRFSLLVQLQRHYDDDDVVAPKLICVRAQGRRLGGGWERERGKEGGCRSFCAIALQCRLSTCCWIVLRPSLSSSSSSSWQQTAPKRKMERSGEDLGKEERRQREDLETVWSDWAFWMVLATNFLTKLAQTSGDFGPFWRASPLLWKKTAMTTFRTTFEKNGYLYILSSGHTA